MFAPSSIAISDTVTHSVDRESPVLLQDNSQICGDFTQKSAANLPRQRMLEVISAPTD